MSEKKPQRRTRRSIRTQLSLAFIALAIVPVLITFLGYLLSVRDVPVRDLEISLGSRIATAQRVIAASLESQISLLRSIAAGDELEQILAVIDSRYTGTAAEIEANLLALDAMWRESQSESDPLIRGVLDHPVANGLKEFNQSFPDHVEVFITDRYGAAVAATNLTSDYYQADEAWWQAAWNNGAGAIYVAQAVDFDDSAGAFSINMAVPIIDDNTSQVIGILRTTYNIGAMITTLESLRFLETGRIELVDSQGYALFVSQATAGEANTPFIAPSQLDTPTNPNPGIVNTKLNGTQVLVKSAVLTTGGQSPVIDSLNWHIVALESEEEVFRAINAMITVVIAGVAIIVVIVGMISFVGARWFVSPLGVLTDAASQLRSGDLKARAEIKRQDEFGVLADTFNAMSDQIQSSISNLEVNVAARTRDLATTVEVGQLATSIYEERELTPKLVEYIRAQFGLYYTQIYFIDEARRYAVLRHGTGDVGKELLARQHKLDLAQTSIVARVVQTREPVLVANTEASDIHRPNPLLPNTHSEAALPLVAGDEVFGVLDMQAERAGTFNPENLSVFQAMANQVASALRGAQAYSRAQEAIERAETINRRLTSDTWKGYLDKSKAAGRIGYEYNLESPQPLSHELKHTPEKVVEKDRATQPILLRGQQIGTLLVQEDNDWREWRPDELTLIEGVAGRVAQALEQFRAFDETQSALQATEALYRVSGEVNRAATLDDILQTLVNLTAVGQFDRANFLMFDRPWVDEKPDTATVMAVWERDGSAPRAPLGTAYPVAAFPFIDMMETDKPFIVADRDSDALTDETLRSVLQRLGMRSVVFFALVANNEWVGLLTAQSGNPRSVSDDQVRQLISVSGQAANVIQNIRLLEQARKRALEMETVANVSAAAATILDVNSLLQAVVDLTKQSFNLYHAHVYLLNETGDTLVLVAGSGDVGQAMKDRDHSIALNHEASVVATAARTRKGVVIGDVAQNPTHLPNPLLPETRSEMAVPMVVGEVLVGVLDVQSQQVNHFTLEDLRIQSTLADQISVAVENARAYQRQLETAEKLREVDRLKSQFLANMSHELRTPLNSIIGYSEVLLDGIDGDLTEDAIEDVEAIHSGGRHLLTMINEILDLAKIEAGQMKLERRRTELEEIVTDAVHTSQILVKDKSVELKVVAEPDMPPVFGDPIRIRQIILNLLSNASKFTENGEIVVSYGLQDNQTAFVKVQDTGIGMSPEGLTLIFEQFQQVDGSSTRRAGGTGLGLTITRYLVDMHQGEIFVESELGIGSTFWFTLPLHVAEEIPTLEAK